MGRDIVFRGTDTHPCYAGDDSPLVHSIVDGECEDCGEMEATE